MSMVSESSENEPQSAVSIHGETGEPVVISPTPELLESLDLAAKLSRSARQQFNYAFHPLLLGLEYGRHGISKWLYDFIAKSNIDRAAVLSFGHLNGVESAVLRVVKEVVEPDQLYSGGRRTATVSALRWIGQAKALSEEQGHTRVGLRHLVGAIVFTPDLHETELRSWGFDRRRWAANYLGYLRDELPNDHAFWERVNARVFPPPQEEIWDEASVTPVTGHTEQQDWDEASVPTTSGGTYLLAWDPTMLSLTDLRGPSDDVDFALGWTRRDLWPIPVGSRVFAMRRDAPRGLVGVGEVLTFPILEVRGRSRKQVRIAWEALGEAPLVRLERLTSELGHPDLWERRGVVLIPSEIAQRLEDLWRDTVAASAEGKSKASPGLDPTTARSKSLARIANDGIAGVAHIDIHADVQSIARVMCMQQVTPPLSIALFGNWGSGKSFFMEQLRSEVARIKISNDAGGAGKSFYGNIIQINFNAWHYVEANLWSSLVSHIFENLRDSTNGKTQDWVEQRNNLIAQLGIVSQSKLRAEQDLLDARRRETDAQQNLIIKQNAAQDKQLALQQVTTKDILKRLAVPHGLATHVQKAAEILGLSSALQSAEDVSRTLQDARRFGNESIAFWRTLWSAPGFGKRLVFIAMAFLLPPLGAVVMAWLTELAGTPQWKQVTQSIAAIVAFLVPLLRLWEQTRRNAKIAMDALQSANGEFENLLKDQQAEHDIELARASLEHERATDAVKTAENTLTVAEQSVVDAKTALVSTSPGRILNAFIEERSASDDYRKNLGTLALVRRDFEKLSNLLSAARDSRNGKPIDSKELEAELRALQSALPEIDRIILYIDDLDRCPPKQVVEVLQAIHLLLAFELFVVVVGVDPRWVSQSLHKHYPELLGDAVAPKAESDDDDGSELKAARPLDYLEKIFQIPFWIRPIGEHETGALVRGLLSSHLRPPASTGGKQNPSTDSLPILLGIGGTGDTGVSGDTGDTGGSGGTDETPSSDDAGKAEAGGSTGASIALTANDEELVGTQLSDAELAFMSRISAVAGKTPRAIKRCINIYMLLRARVPKNREAEFEGTDGVPREFEAVMYLLALFNRAPSFARRFCVELEKCRTRERGSENSMTEGTGDNPLTTELGVALQQVEAIGGLSSMEKDLLKMLQSYVLKFVPSGASPTIDAFCRWHPVVSRYSFVGGSPSDAAV